MRIGQLATTTGVPARTIRYYEQIGVLPQPQRTEAGYRDYADGAAERLRFVRAAQGVGLRLAAIREVLQIRDAGEPPCVRVLELLRRRAHEASVQIAELERLRDELDRVVARGLSLDPKDCSPSCVCQVIEAGGPR